MAAPPYHRPTGMRARRDDGSFYVTNPAGDTVVPKTRRVAWVRLAGLVIIGLIVAGVIWGVHRHHGQQAPQTQTIQATTAAVSRHMQLPQGEEPVLATVTDHAALQTAFLREAQDGDKILIYEKARKVIIYRPSIDRIIDVGPVELDDIPKNSSQ